MRSFVVSSHLTLLPNSFSSSSKISWSFFSVSIFIRWNSASSTLGAGGQAESRSSIFRLKLSRWLEFSEITCGSQQDNSHIVTFQSAKIERLNLPVFVMTELHKLSQFGLQYFGACLHFTLSLRYAPTGILMCITSILRRRIDYVICHRRLWLRLSAAGFLPRIPKVPPSEMRK